MTAPLDVYEKIRVLRARGHSIAQTAKLARVSPGFVARCGVRHQALIASTPSAERRDAGPAPLRTGHILAALP